jgi:parallel beta-helix repeat protein
MTTGPRNTPYPIVLHVDATGTPVRLAESSSIYVPSVSALTISATTYLGLESGGGIPGGFVGNIQVKSGNTTFAGYNALRYDTAFGALLANLVSSTAISAITLRAGTVSATNYLNLPSTNLSSLLDVQYASVSGGQALIYSSSINKWVPGYTIFKDDSDPNNSLGQSGDIYFRYIEDSTNAAYLSSLLDTNINAVSNGQSLIWSSGYWIPSAIPTSQGTITSIPSASPIWNAASAEGYDIQWGTVGGLAPAPLDILGFSIFDIPVKVTNYRASDAGPLLAQYTQLNALSNLDVGNAQQNNLLSYNGTDWVAVSSIRLNSISATNWQGLPSATPIWNANKIGNLAVSYGTISPFDVLGVGLGGNTIQNFPANFAGQFLVAQANLSALADVDDEIPAANNNVLVYVNGAWTPSSSISLTSISATNYYNLPSASFYFQSLSANTFSATNYLNIPSSVYNIKNFGAKGDGVSNDGIAISAAIEAAYTAGGGTVFIPAGVYVAQRILVKPGVKLLGADKYSSKIKKPAVLGSNTSYGISTSWMHSIIELQSNSTVENIFIDGNLSYSDATGTAGICAQEASGFYVKDVIASSCGGNGMQFYRVYNATLENVEVYKSRRTGSVNSFNNEGVGLFFTVFGASLPNHVKYLNKIKVLNCISNNNDLDGIIGQQQGLEIIGGSYNYNGNNPFPGVWGANGVYLASNETIYSPDGTTKDVYPDIKICNITARGNTEAGILFAASGATISNNICYENQGMGIWVQNTKDSVISNNVCFNNGYVTNIAQGNNLLPLLEFRAGISMFGYCRNVNISNNILFEDRNLTATYTSGRKAGQVWGIYANTARNASLEAYIGTTRKFENISLNNNSIRNSVSGASNFDKISYEPGYWEPSTIISESYIGDGKILGYSSVLVSSISASSADLSSVKLSKYVEPKSTVNISSSAITLNLNNSQVFEISAISNISSITIQNADSRSNIVQGFTIIFSADGTQRTVTNWGSIKWPGGTGPTLTSTNNKKDILSFMSPDNGTNWYGFIGGQNF